MANTFVKIASYTATGTVANIDFTSIPSTYTDLVLKVSTRATTGGVGSNTFLRFNGSTTTYTYKLLEGDGTTAASYSGSTSLNGVGSGTGATANTFGSFEIYIPNYAGSTNKSYSSDSVAENNGSTGVQDLMAGLWSTTSAINQITLLPNSGSFVQYSTATLYGISKS